MDLMNTKKKVLRNAVNRECLLCAVNFRKERRLMYLVECSHIICTNCFTRRFEAVDGTKSNCPSCDTEFENKDVIRIRDEEVIFAAAEKDFGRYNKVSHLLHLEDAVYLNKKYIPAHIEDEEHVLFGYLPNSLETYFMNSLKLSTYHLPVWSKSGCKMFIPTEYETSVKSNIPITKNYDDNLPIRPSQSYVFDHYSPHKEVPHRYTWTQDCVVRQYPFSSVEDNKSKYSLLGVADERPKNDTFYGTTPLTLYPASAPRSILQYPPSPEEILGKGTGFFAIYEKRNYPMGTDLRARSRQSPFLLLNYPHGEFGQSFSETPFLNLSAMSFLEKHKVWATINHYNTISHPDIQVIVDSVRCPRFYDVFFKYFPSNVGAEGYIPSKYRFYYLLFDLCLVQPNSGLDRIFKNSDDLLKSINNEYRLAKTLYYDCNR